MGGEQRATSLKVTVCVTVPSSRFSMLTRVSFSVPEFRGYSKASVTQSHSDLPADAVLALPPAFSACSKW